MCGALLLTTATGVAVIAGPGPVRWRVLRNLAHHNAGACPIDYAAFARRGEVPRERVRIERYLFRHPDLPATLLTGNQDFLRRANLVGPYIRSKVGRAPFLLLVPADDGNLIRTFPKLRERRSLPGKQANFLKSYAVAAVD